MNAVHDDAPPYVYPIRPEWLARRRDDAIEPEWPVLDAHHHFSDRPDYLYLLDDLIEDMAGGHRVVATVFVEGRWGDSGGDEVARGIEETATVAGFGADAEERGIPGVAAAIVGNSDLTRGAGVAGTLQAHIAAGAGRFRGIRQICPWHPSPRLHLYGPDEDPHLLADPRFREGFAQLAPLGLSFDAWLFHTQYEELVALAEAFPDTRIILDFAVPIGIASPAEEMPQWRTAVRRVARCPNIVLKLGGYGLGLCGFRFAERADPPGSAELAHALRPYFEESVEAFGAGRCMLGSNFPVDKGSFGYTMFWNAAKRLVADLPVGERNAILSANAASVYRIEI